MFTDDRAKISLSSERVPRDSARAPGALRLGVSLHEASPGLPPQGVESGLPPKMAQG